MKNMVVTGQLKQPVALRRISTSTANVFYESELFPAILIRKWSPVHIAVFHNGKCTLTGCKSLEHAESVFRSLSDYIQACNLYSIK